MLQRKQSVSVMLIVKLPPSFEILSFPSHCRYSQKKIKIKVKKKLKNNKNKDKKGTVVHVVELLIQRLVKIKHRMGSGPI